MYAWLITKDHLESETGDSDVGTRGPRQVTLTANEIQNHPNARRFRLLDADSEVYYEGLIIGARDGFEPLDDFGMPNAGCTTIQYWEEGGWKTL